MYYTLSVFLFMYCMRHVLCFKKFETPLNTRYCVDCYYDEVNDTQREAEKVNQSRYRPEVPRGFLEVTVPRLHDNGPG